MFQTPVPNPNPNPSPSPSPSPTSNSNPNPSSCSSSSGSGSSPDSPKSLFSRGEALYDLKRQALLRELSWQLAHGDRASRVQAARDIRRLARVSIRARSAFAVDAVVSPLVAMLPSPEREEREAALPALLNLAVRNEPNKVTIVESGALPPLVEPPKIREQRSERACSSCYFDIIGCRIKQTNHYGLGSCSTFGSHPNHWEHSRES